MLYVLDSKEKVLGCIVDGYVTFCFDNLGNQIGTIGKNDGMLYLYNKDNKLIAIYNGRNTINPVGDLIDKGNVIYEILYPTYSMLKTKV